jgi:hypothetical protein
MSDYLCNRRTGQIENVKCFIVKKYHHLSPRLPSRFTAKRKQIDEYTHEREWDGAGTLLRQHCMYIISSAQRLVVSYIGTYQRDK